MKKVRPPKKKTRSKNFSVPTENSGSTSHLKPVFSLEHLQKKYCLSKCVRDEKSSFADTLLKLSSFTWNQLSSMHRHKLGFEKIDRNSLKVSVPKIAELEDVNIIAFRFCGKKAMIGYRRSEKFSILWLDRDFTVYPHGS